MLYIIILFIFMWMISITGFKVFNDQTSYVIYAVISRRCFSIPSNLFWACKNHGYYSQYSTYTIISNMCVPGHSNIISKPIKQLKNHLPIPPQTVKHGIPNTIRNHANDFSLRMNSKLCAQILNVTILRSIKWAT